MDENLADIIVVSVMWICAAFGSYFLKNEIPFALALAGTLGFVWFTRN